MFDVCWAPSGVRKIAPPIAWPLLFENVQPQIVSVPSSPPSIDTAPPLPPAPVSRCPPTTGHVELVELAPWPMAWFCVNVSLTSVRSLLSEPTAPPFDALLPANWLPTIVVFVDPVV